MMYVKESVLKKKDFILSYGYDDTSYKELTKSKKFKSQFTRMKQGIFLNKIVKPNPLRLSNALMNRSYVTGLTALNFYGISPNNPSTIFSMSKYPLKEESFFGYRFVAFKNPNYDKVNEFGLFHWKKIENDYVAIACPELALADFVHIETFIEKHGDVHELFLDSIDTDKLSKIADLYPIRTKKAILKLIQSKCS